MKSKEGQHSDFLKGIFGYSADIHETVRLRKKGKHVDKKELLNLSNSLKDTDRKKSDDYLVLYLFLTDSCDLGKYRDINDSESFKKYTLSDIDRILSDAPLKKNKRKLIITIVAISVLIVLIGVLISLYFLHNNELEDTNINTEIETTESETINEDPGPTPETETKEDVPYNEVPDNTPDNTQETEPVDTIKIESNLLEGGVITLTSDTTKISLTVDSILPKRIPLDTLNTLLTSYGIDTSFLHNQSGSFSLLDSYINKADLKGISIDENDLNTFVVKLKELLNDSIADISRKIYSISDPIKIDISLYSDRAYLFINEENISENDLCSFREFLIENYPNYSFDFSILSASTVRISFDTLPSNLTLDTIRTLISDYLNQSESTINIPKEEAPLSDAIIDSNETLNSNSLSESSKKFSLDTSTYIRRNRLWVEEKNTLTLSLSPYTFSYSDFLNYRNAFTKDEVQSDYGFSLGARYLYKFNKLFYMGFDADFSFFLINNSTNSEFSANKIRKDNFYSISLLLDFAFAIEINSRMNVLFLLNFGPSFINQRINTNLFGLELFIKGGIETLFSYRISEHIRLNAGLSFSLDFSTDKLTSNKSEILYSLSIPTLSLTYIF